MNLGGCEAPHAVDGHPGETGQGTQRGTAREHGLAHFVDSECAGVHAHNVLVEPLPAVTLQRGPDGAWRHPAGDECLARRDRRHDGEGAALDAREVVFGALLWTGWRLASACGVARATSAADASGVS